MTEHGIIDIGRHGFEFFAKHFYFQVVIICSSQMRYILWLSKCFRNTGRFLNWKLMASSNQRLRGLLWLQVDGQINGIRENQFCTPFVVTVTTRIPVSSNRKTTVQRIAGVKTPLIASYCILKVRLNLYNIHTRFNERKPSPWDSSGKLGSHVPLKNICLNRTTSYPETRRQRTRIWKTK